MNAKNLQKATKVLAEIHELDKELIALDKKAQSIADGNDFLSVKIEFEKEETKKEATQSDELDISSMYRIMMPSLYKTENKSNKEIVKFNMNPNECLFVIGALISCKKECRRLLCDKIIELGVSI